MEIGPDGLVEFGGELGFVQALAHVVEPGGLFGFSDGESNVAHAQAGVAALFRIGAGSAKILHQEELESLGGGFQVFFGVEGAQQGILGHSEVKTADQFSEEVLTTNLFVKHDLRFAAQTTGSSFPAEDRGGRWVGV